MTTTPQFGAGPKGWEIPTADNAKRIAAPKGVRRERLPANALSRPRSTNNNREGKRMGIIKETLKFGAILSGMAMIAIAVAPAHAGANCNDKGVNAFGDIGGGPFNVPADTRSLTGPSDEFIALSSEDCDRFDDAKRDARRAAAATSVATEAFGINEGLNLTLNGANSGLEDDTYAVGAVVTWKQNLDPSGLLNGFSLKAGFGTDTTGDEQSVGVGATINFGTF